MGGEQAKRTVEYGEFAAMQRDVADIKGLLSTMVETMQRLSLIEERQNNLGLSANKLFEQIEKIVTQQQQHQIADALNANLASRVAAIETLHRELHVENERNKTRFQTFSWLLKGAWVAGLAVASVVAWVASHINTSPPPVAPLQPAPMVQTTQQPK